MRYTTTTHLLNVEEVLADVSSQAVVWTRKHTIPPLSYRAVWRERLAVQWPIAGVRWLSCPARADVKPIWPRQ